MSKTIKERLIWLNAQYRDNVGAYQVACEDALEEIERLEAGLRQIVVLRGLPERVGDSDFYKGVLQGHENASIIATRYLRHGAEE